MSEYAGPRQLRRLLDAVMSVGTDLELPVVLRRITEAGRELVDARYAALGVLDPTGTHLAEFVTAGMSEEERQEIGELPKGHGLLGLLITSPEPVRVPDLTEHGERYGFPARHPQMRSFLGVPLYVHGRVFGNLYFTEKSGGDVFTDIDEELAVGLAAAAAVAIENARLHERTQELSLAADRERLGRDLHDTVIQRVFATGLAMHTTARLCHDTDIQQRIVAHIDELDEVVRQLRSAIFQLDVGRAAAVGGAREQVLHVAAEAGRALGFSPAVTLDGPIDTVADDVLCSHVVAVVREALSNVARHAHATRVEVRLAATGDELVLEITDDGVGITDPDAIGDGLRNMRQRARELGGDATVDGPAGAGTAVRWTAPIGAVRESSPTTG